MIGKISEYCPKVEGSHQTQLETAYHILRRFLSRYAAASTGPAFVAVITIIVIAVLAYCAWYVFRRIIRGLVDNAWVGTLVCFACAFFVPKPVAGLCLSAGLLVYIVPTMLFLMITSPIDECMG